MTLLAFPDELLALIVSHAIPEGFESLCLSCRKFHILCKPLIKQHNVLRSRFRNFNYHVKHGHQSLHYVKRGETSLTITSSFELLARIAEWPIVARYIERADLKADSRLNFGARLSFMERNGYRRETVRDLFASSRYLSGTEWQDYFTKYERDAKDNRYCQAAAAFLLTLLPNVKSVDLPKLWTSDRETEKLLETVVEHARRPSTTSSNASLSLLTTLETSFSFANRQGFVLDKITPLLALPRIHTFHGPTSISHIGVREPPSPCQALPPRVGGTLQIAHLLGSNLDGSTMASFLRCTPRLKTLVYSHSDKQLSTIWDICALVTAIGNEVGSHLEELSITKHDFTGKIALGTTTVRHFTRLHKLEMPMDLATCVIRSAGAHRETEEGSAMEHAADVDLEHGHLLLCGLVPASVTRLFLRSDEWDRHDDGHESRGPLAIEMSDGIQVFEGQPQQHARTLDTMFHSFAERKAAQLPSLKEIRVSYPTTADEAYKARCQSLQTEAGRVGVEVHLKETRWTQALGFAES